MARRADRGGFLKGKEQQRKRALDRLKGAFTPKGRSRIREPREIRRRIRHRGGWFTVIEHSRIAEKERKRRKRRRKMARASAKKNRGKKCGRKSPQVRHRARKPARRA